MTLLCCNLLASRTEFVQEGETYVMSPVVRGSPWLGYARRLVFQGVRMGVWRAPLMTLLLPRFLSRLLSVDRIDP